MVRIKLIELTEDFARYKFFPEKSEDCGIVALNRINGERIIEMQAAGYGNQYAAHSLRRIEEYRKTGDYIAEDTIAWY